MSGGRGPTMGPGAASPCRDGQGIDASAPKFPIIPAEAGSVSFWRSC